MNRVYDKFLEFFKIIKVPKVDVYFKDSTLVDSDFDVNSWNPKIPIPEKYTYYDYEVSFLGYKNVLEFQAFCESKIEDLKSEISSNLSSPNLLPVLIRIKNDVKEWLSKISIRESRFTYSYEVEYNGYMKIISLDYLYKHQDELVTEHNQIYDKFGHSQKRTDRQFRIVYSYYYFLLAKKLEFFLKHIKDLIKNMPIENKSSGKDKEELSFCLINMSTSRFALHELYKELKIKNFISKGQRYTHFRQIFEGKIPSKKINWIRTIDSLRYFLKYMMDNEIIEKVSTGLYDLISQCFKKNDLEIDPNKIEHASHPSKTDTDMIIRMFEKFDENSDYLYNLIQS
jgi:hypothetical protein